MKSVELSDYQDRYDHVTFHREDGILQVTLHSGQREIVWGAGPHKELGYVFEDIGRDRENKVIILTGTGQKFIDDEDLAAPTGVSPRYWATIHYDAKRLIMSHLDIEAPMISAVNGPATVHAELALLCDINLAAEHATFADAAHWPNGLVPGDGVQILWPLLLGVNRARYFLLTEQHLSASEALDLGVVNEVLPADALLPRAWELARQLRTKPELTTRLTRTALVQQLKTAFHDGLGYGLMLEGIAGQAHWPKE